MRELREIDLREQPFPTAIAPIVDSSAPMIRGIHHTSRTVSDMDRRSSSTVTDSGCRSSSTPRCAARCSSRRCDARSPPRFVLLEAGGPTRLELLQYLPRREQRSQRLRSPPTPAPTTWRSRRRHPRAYAELTEPASSSPGRPSRSMRALSGPLDRVLPRPRRPDRRALAAASDLEIAPGLTASSTACRGRGQSEKSCKITLAPDRFRCTCIDDFGLREPAALRINRDRMNRVAIRDTGTRLTGRCADRHRLPSLSGS